MSDVLAINPDDPAMLGYPPTLPLEIAMQTSSVKDICAAYGIDKAQWDIIRANAAFKAQVQTYLDELKTEGVSFRMKARLQAEALLETSWNLIHEPHALVPPNVKADLIKFTIRAAGLDGSKDQGGGNVGTALQINVNL